MCHPVRVSAAPGQDARDAQTTLPPRRAGWHGRAARSLAGLGEAGSIPRQLAVEGSLRSRSRMTQPLASVSVALRPERTERRSEGHGRATRSLGSLEVGQSLAHATRLCPPPPDSIPPQLAVEGSPRPRPRPRRSPMPPPPVSGRAKCIPSTPAPHLPQAGSAGGAGESAATAGVFTARVAGLYEVPATVAWARRGEEGKTRLDDLRC